ncbi:MAG: DUF1667 domain-containing protein [Clostridia bacterium]
MMICIECPNGCHLSYETIDGEIIVKGNKCKRGENFLKEELTCPKRTICSTVATTFKDFPVLPVRTSAVIPKEKIFDVMAQLNNALVEKRLKRGDVVIKNVLNTGVDIIATTNM